MAATKSEYKGSKVLTLSPDDAPDTKYPFSFGVAKAKLIMSNLDAIREFIKESDPSFTE